MTATSNLDFEELLSREFRPAEVVCLQPREKFHPHARDHHHHHHQQSKSEGGASKNRSRNNNSNNGSNNSNNNNTKGNSVAAAAAAGVLASNGVLASSKELQDAAKGAEEEARAKQREFVLRLVAQTPNFRQHLSPEERQKVWQDRDKVCVKLPSTSTSLDPNLTSATTVLPAFGPLALSDWASNINWEGVPAGQEESTSLSKTDTTTKPTTTTTTTTNSENNASAGSPALKTDNQAIKSDADLIKQARAHLAKPRNPFLDNLVLDETTVCWDGMDDPETWATRAAQTPLILQMGVAGRSVADKIYLGLSAQRPAAATQEAAYQARMERETNHNSSSSSAAMMMVSAAEATKTKGSLHQDKEKFEAFVEARQKKRAEMAKEKTSRITKAMDTLHLGGGRSRTITSSLMGPGGTERTGRPSRSMAGTFLEAEYLEQLDMVQNHSLVRDLSKILLRQYHRPKLPLSVVRQDLSWQFQIRYAPNKKESTSAQVTSFISPHSGQLAKAKFRSEADLSPSEGKLVLLEYCEERPPIQLVKGMRTKIINYYRGDKAHCPVSAGGGDRPARKKRTDESASKAVVATSKTDRLPRLRGPDRETTVLDWVGKLPKKSKEKRAEQDAIDVLPEGVTEILHPKVHGPFIGEIEEGTTISSLVSNLFVAPIFRHERESTDFLMILTPPSGAARPGQRESMGVILRDFPSSIFCVGQTEPRQRVNAPSSPDEKKYLGPFISYQIAKTLARAQARDGHGLRLDELSDRVLPNAEIPSNALRQRLKQVATYDKNTQIWTPKSVGFEGYRGVEALGKEISPESVVAYETASAASRRLTDLGIHFLFSGDKTAMSVGVAMTYLSGQTVSANKLMKQIKAAAGLWQKTNGNRKGLDSQQQTAYYEKASAELQSYYKMLKEKHDVAQFIYEELQLAPWHLTGEFIDVHKKSEGSGMMQLSGLGDPSGFGEGFSFLRKVDNKPAKATAAANSALNDHVKKITGTEDDLRKLTMKEMAEILRKFGNMGDKEIAALKRWDRVYVIREISTRAASDRVGAGLERFARDEKFKLSEQKKDYRKKIQTIWKRQIATLSTDPTEKGGADGDGTGGPGGSETDTRANAHEPKKAEVAKKEDSDDDSDFEDDDLVAEIEDEMINRPEATGIVASRKSDGNEGDEKDAHEFAALMKQREEERAAKEDFSASAAGGKQFASQAGFVKRKVIRRRITKTLPDGKQTTSFKFICNPKEVGEIMAKLESQEKEQKRKSEMKYQHGEDEKPPGHAMFEDEDDFEYSSKGRQTGRRRGAGRRRQGERAPSRARGALQFGSRKKEKGMKEEKSRKRRREEEELEVYNVAKRKTTNNRRERGSIRDRRPHVIFAEKLENIRSQVESRPHAGPFVKPVNRRVIPRYYEVISNPIDLQTMRDRISRYEYRTADALVKDFELMKQNAIKFNSEASQIAQEAIAIYDFVRSAVEASRSELTKLEEAVEDQMSGKSKKKRKHNDSSASGTVARIGDVSVNLGDLNDFDSDSGDDAEVFVQS